MSRITQLAHRYYETVDSGDAEATIALFAPDAVYRRGGYEPMRGADIGEFYRGARIIASGRHTLHEILAEEDSAAGHGVFEGTLKDGRETSIGFADFFRFDAGGLITARTSYFFTAGV